MLFVVVGGTSGGMRGVGRGIIILNRWEGGHDGFVGSFCVSVATMAHGLVTVEMCNVQNVNVKHLIYHIHYPQARHLTLIY